MKHHSKCRPHGLFEDNFRHQTVAARASVDNFFGRSREKCYLAHSPQVRFGFAEILG